ncbi:AI-2E family transporter [Faecalibacillus intestinalis]|uniref:AI-2E family transporter n=1 Tax=Faecalibacillus intestinalis TaxID=1982626 RepID=UPI000E52D85E|nr:AI-2E family transporter [Coprobacillus sp. AF24-1LB]
MEKKKRWLINFLYYGIIFSIGCLIVYILLKKCLIVVLSYLSAILLKPFIDLILEKLHIKNKVFSIIMTIIIFILLYTCFFLFIFFSCLFFIKTLSFLPSFIETVYQELLSHQYLISFFTQFYQQIQTLIQNILSTSIHYVLSLAMNMVHFIACLFIHFFLTMLFLFHQPLIQRKKESLYTTLISSFTETFIIIIKTYSILFVITFIGLFLGFQVIGIKQALNFSFFIAFFDFFPVLGIEMIMFPWIITLALLNQISLSLKLLILYGIIALIRNILEPHLLSKKIKIPGLYMFVAMYLFMKLMGIWGVMVAPFVLLVLNNFRQKNNFQEIYKIIKKSL